MFNSEVLNNFVRIGSIDGVRLCLDNNVNPNAWNNWAIRYAIALNHIDIVKLLLDDRRVADTIVKGHVREWAVNYKRFDIYELITRKDFK